MTATNETRPEVTQADREAAAQWAKMQSRHMQAANMLRGSCDTAPLVQLMSRHRTATEAVSRAENEALKRSAEALMKEKHKEAAEARLWFGKAQEWKQELAASRAEVERLREVAGLYERAFDAAKAFIESHVADPDITDEMTVNYWRNRQHSEAVEVSRALLARQADGEGAE